MGGACAKLCVPLPLRRLRDPSPEGALTERSGAWHRGGRAVFDTARHRVVSYRTLLSTTGNPAADHGRRRG